MMAISKLERLIAELCPEGVEYAEFGNLCQYIRGITYNKSQETNADDATAWKVLRANNITLSSNTLNYEDVKLVSSEVKVRDNQKLRKGDILICAGSGSKEHIGKVAFINEGMDYTFGGFMAVIRCPGVLDSRFLFHVLTGEIFGGHLDKALNSSTINNLNASVMQGLRFPLPPLPIQREIVRILDQFTELTAELAAELAARQKQYEYYRNFLLTFDKNVVAESANNRTIEQSNNERRGAGDGRIQWLTIGELCNISRGKVISKDFIRDNQGKYPVYSSQTENDGVLGTISTYEYDGEYLTWTTDGANAGTVFHRSGRFSITNVCGLLKPDLNMVNTRYLYFILGITAVKYVSKGMGNPKLMSNTMSRVRVPVPPLPEQARIVAILDKFDALTTDLSSGLPAEIAARRAQYEYYRDALLTFKELPA